MRRVILRGGSLAHVIAGALPSRDKALCGASPWPSPWEAPSPDQRTCVDCLNRAMRKGGKRGR